MWPCVLLAQGTENHPGTDVLIGAGVVLALYLLCRPGGRCRPDSAAGDDARGDQLAPPSALPHVKSYLGELEIVDEDDTLKPTDLDADDGKKSRAGAPEHACGHRLHLPPLCSDDDVARL